MWIDVNDRLPERDGEYRVMRRAIGKRPEYEDVCRFIRNRSDRDETYWTNRNRVVISSVTRWWEEDDA